MAIINIKNLVHNYITYDDGDEEAKKVNAIDDVDVSIEPGEYVAILGKNGSGKTSLAKHINGLLLPSSGYVYVKGMDTKENDKILDIRQSTGIVFQNPDNQIVGTTVEEDVAFGPENMGIPVDDIWQRITRTLTAVGMTAYKEASPNHLSGGQKQRVAIAGIMAMEPECIVLDEPTAMLDPEGRRHVLGLVHALNQEKHITILMVTHHMEEVCHANRIIVMDEGKIAMDGTPREIFSRVDEMKALGLEVPFATELADELRKEGLDLPDTIMTREELVEALCQLS